MDLKPCPFRQVDDEGHILCEKIKSGDREVSPSICRACPVAQINCAHLRATLDHQARSPLTVRYGNGKTEIWDDPAPPIALQRAACAAKVISILSPRDCAGCPIQAPVSVDAVAMSTPRGAPALVNATQAILPPGAGVRANIVAQKAIQFQQWLARQSAVPQKENADDKGAVFPITVEPGPVRVPPGGEEKCVGWTD